MDDLERLVGEQLYQTVETYEDGRSLVMDVPAKTLYFKKILQVYDISVFAWLRDHPDSHVPEVHDFWQDGDSLVVIEELIHGQTLEELLETENLPFAGRRRILLELCDALIFLHSAVPPIIHRDLKPSNVMVTEDGAVKLIDYDAAKTFKGNEKEDTFLMGTHGIAAPEQYGFAESDARTDIFALGRLILRMLPESGAAAKIAEKATKLDPDERYSSVREVKRLLENVREPVKPAEKRSRSGKFAAFVIGFAAAAVVVFLCFHFLTPSGKIEAGGSAAASAETDSAKEEAARLQTLYQEAADLYDSGDYASAADKFKALGDYSDAAARVSESRYQDAAKYFDHGDYKNAARKFEVLGDYSDAATRALESSYRVAAELYDSGDYKDAAKKFESLGDYSDAAERASESHYQYALSMASFRKFTVAIEELKSISGYKDAAQQALDLEYSYCSEHAERPDDASFTYLQDLLRAGYAGADALSQEMHTWHAEVSWEVSYVIGSMQAMLITAKLYGGGDGTSTSVTFVIIDDATGQSKSYTPEGTFSRNEEISCTLSSSGGEGLIGNSCTVQVYDGDGNMIGSKSGVIEYPAWVND